jgi:hypothetical protein
MCKERLVELALLDVHNNVDITATEFIEHFVSSRNRTKLIFLNLKLFYIYFHHIYLLSKI